MLGNEGAYLPSDGTGTVPQKYWKAVNEAATLAQKAGLINDDRGKENFLTAIRNLLTPSQGLPLSEVVSSDELIKKYLEASKKPIEFEGLHTGLGTLDKTLLGVQDQNFMVICARTGVGKCFKKGTKVLMADGQQKEIEKVKVGEKVQGLNAPRIVLGTHNGFGTSYKVTPENGEPFFITDRHIFSFVFQNDKNYTPYDIFVEDLLTTFTKTDADGYVQGISLYRPPVEYAEQYLEKIPHPAGMGFCVSNLEYYSSDRGSLPREYLVNSREIRLEFLAGMVDATGEQGDECIFTMPSIVVSQVMQLARGLGFKATITTTSADNLGVANIKLQGKLSELPTLRNYKDTIGDPLTTRFKVEKAEDCEYFGIAVDGDQHFLLYDNTLVHNTLLANYMIAHFAKQGQKILYLALEESEQEVGDRWAKIVNNNQIEVPGDNVGFLYAENISAIKEDKYNIIPLIAAASQLGYTMVCVDMLNNLIDTVRDEHANAFLNRLLDEAHRTGMTLVMTARLRQPLNDKEREFPSMESVYGRVDLGYIVSKCIGVTALPDELDGNTYLRLHILKNRRKQIGMKARYPKIRVNNLLKIEDIGDDGMAEELLQGFEENDGASGRPKRGGAPMQPKGNAKGADF